MDDGCYDSIEQIDPNEFLTPETSVTCLCNEDGCNGGDTDTIKLSGGDTDTIELPGGDTDTIELPGELSESRSCTILLFK